MDRNPTFTNENKSRIGYSKTIFFQRHWGVENRWRRCKRVVEIYFRNSFSITFDSLSGKISSVINDNSMRTCGFYVRCIKDNLQ